MHKRKKKVNKNKDVLLGAVVVSFKSRHQGRNWVLLSFIFQERQICIIEMHNNANPTGSHFHVVLLGWLWRVKATRLAETFFCCVFVALLRSLIVAVFILTFCMMDSIQENVVTPTRPLFNFWNAQRCCLMCPLLLPFPYCLLLHCHPIFKFLSYSTFIRMHPIPIIPHPITIHTLFSG